MAPKEPQVKTVLVLNWAHDYEAVKCQRAGARTDATSHPAWDEGQWRGMLERFVGTTSARAVGGSPLTELWLLLWTINCCKFLFSLFPPSFPPPQTLLHEVSFTLRDDHSAPTWTLPSTRHERRPSWCNWPSKLTQTRTRSQRKAGMLGMEEWGACSWSVNAGSNRQEIKLCSDLAVLDRWLLNTMYCPVLSLFRKMCSEKQEVMEKFYGIL